MSCELISKEKFDSKWIPEPFSGCWIWTGSVDRDGYGMIGRNHTTYIAHRISWLIYKSQIPDGLLICHKCDTPGCVNPDHLFLGTDRDNADDSVLKGRKRKKLSPEQALMIRSSTKGTSVLARELKVNESTIYKIRKRIKWKWL